MKNLQIRLSIRIQQEGQYGNALDLNQEFTMPDCDFESMARVMKRFHDLMEEMKAAQ